MPDAALSRKRQIKCRTVGLASFCNFV